LRTWQWKARFYKILGIPWLAEVILISQEGLRSVLLFNSFVGIYKTVNYVMNFRRQHQQKRKEVINYSISFQTRIFFVRLFTVPGVRYSLSRYRGADKSLARPGRKQASVCVRMRWISFGACLAGKEARWQLASRCCWNRARPWHASETVSFLVGLRTYQHLGIFFNIHNIREY
jgi:hypothetical protein